MVLPIIMVGGSRLWLLSEGFNDLNSCRIPWSTIL